MLGRSFTICYMIFGVLTVALPVLTVVTVFTKIYPKNVEWEDYQQNNAIMNGLNDLNDDKKDEAKKRKSSRKFSDLV